MPKKDMKAKFLSKIRENKLSKQNWTEEFVVNINDNHNNHFAYSKEVSKIIIKLIDYELDFIFLLRKSV